MVSACKQQFVPYSYINHPNKGQNGMKSKWVHYVTGEILIITVLNIQLEILWSKHLHRVYQLVRCATQGKKKNKSFHAININTKGHTDKGIICNQALIKEILWLFWITDTWKIEIMSNWQKKKANFCVPWSLRPIKNCNMSIN